MGPQPGPRAAPDIDRVLAKLAVQEGLRTRLPSGGRLFIDRPLPFLCLYRPPAGEPDTGTARLVRSEAAYLIAPGGAQGDRDTRRLVEAIAARGRDRFGTFLLVEVASAPVQRGTHRAGDRPLGPGFEVIARRGERLEPVLDALLPALGDIRIQRRSAKVELTRTGSAFKPLFTSKRARELGIDQLAVLVEPVFRSADGEIFPIVLRRLQRLLALALRRGLHGHASAHARQAPASYRALGRKTLVAAVRQVDRELAEVAGAFDLLLEVTPINLEAAWRRFRRQRFARAPRFDYRPLPVDPALLKRRLFAVPVERIEDPTLAGLMREKQLGLDRELSLLLDRRTRRFLPESIQIFGAVDDKLFELARDLLANLGPRPRETGGRRRVDAQAMAALARAEVARYRSRHPGFASRVRVRADIYPGLLVSKGDLLIGQAARFAPGRVDALLQHEIGTHALTFHNGRAQPLSLLAVGLPGYDELQEGLAVLAEYLVGGLSKGRMRLLAARVVAARMLTDGAGLVDAFRVLTSDHGFAQQAAFNLAARVWRGGGLTKDAVYLRGLDRLIAHLGRGGELDTLFVGKIAIHHIHMIEELIARGVLAKPPLRPACLDRPEAGERLARLRRGASLLDLVE